MKTFLNLVYYTTLTTAWVIGISLVALEGCALWQWMH